jgi:phospholipid/cholesterol/gamma-HCH transport system substrate-binding protein
VSDNAEPLHTTIANLSAFTSALAHNSERVDAILDGLAKMTAGPKTLPIHDLALLGQPPVLIGAPEKKVVIPEPTSLLALDTARMLIERPGTGVTPLENAQWPDNLPKLLQAKIIEAFERAGYTDSVFSRAPEGLEIEHQLMIEIRAFKIVAGDALNAQIELSAKMVGLGGKVLASRSFRSTSPVRSLDPGAVAAGFSEAFRTVLADMILWADPLLRA